MRHRRDQQRRVDTYSQDSYTCSHQKNKIKFLAVYCCYTSRVYFIFFYVSVVTSCVLVRLVRLSRLSTCVLITKLRQPKQWLNDSAQMTKVERIFKLSALLVCHRLEPFPTSRCTTAALNRSRWSWIVHPGQFLKWINIPHGKHCNARLCSHW